jgi:hypothetical protein
MTSKPAPQKTPFLRFSEPRLTRVGRAFMPAGHLSRGQYSRTYLIVSTSNRRKKGEYNDLQEKSLQISLAIYRAYM